MPKPTQQKVDAGARRSTVVQERADDVSRCLLDMQLWLAESGVEAIHFAQHGNLNVVAMIVDDAGVG